MDVVRRSAARTNEALTRSITFAYLGVVVIGSVATLGSVSVWSHFLTTDVDSVTTRTLRTPNVAAAEECRDPSWADIFPETNNFTVGDLTPLSFYETLNHIGSAELTAKLKGPELKGRDVREWLQKERNITIQTSENDVQLSKLAKVYGYDKVAAYTLRKPFVGTELYHSIEKAACQILSEDGLHVMFLGDSTVQGLSGITTGSLQSCATKVKVSKTTRKDNEIDGVVGSGFFHQRAYNPDFESNDYKVPKGTKRVLVIANFDGLHALSIFPSRRFSLMFDKTRFFDGFEDFIRYQLDKISLIPAESYLVTLNVNSVDHERMKEAYYHHIRNYYNNTEGYVAQCASTWDIPPETCRHGVLAQAGADYLSNVIANIVPIDVDVNSMTRHQGFLSPERDGRHYKSLGHLKMAQILTVYMLRRIEKFLSSSSRNACQMQLEQINNKRN